MTKYPVTNRYNLFLFKYGTFFNTVFFLSMLIYIEITPKTLIFWVFILNHIMFSYFLFVRGCALGITQTFKIIEHEEATKAIQEELNKNN